MAPNERGITLIDVLFAVAIGAILLAIVLPNIVSLENGSKEAHLARTAYKALQEWTTLAVLQGGATLKNTGSGLEILGSHGQKDFVGLPSGVTVSLSWTSFPSGACQSLNGNGVPVVQASADCAQPVLSSTNTIPLLAFCYQGVCHGAHS
mgnify:CR=1 FL=1